MNNDYFDMILEGKNVLIRKLKGECDDYIQMIATQDQIIRELMCENKKYKTLYDEHRDEMDKDCWGC